MTMAVKSNTKTWSDAKPAPEQVENIGSLTPADKKKIGAVFISNQKEFLI